MQQASRLPLLLLMLCREAARTITHANATHVSHTVNIRDDEIEHVRTMKACQSPAIAQIIAGKRLDCRKLPPAPPAGGAN